MGQSTVFQCPHCKTSLRVESLGPSQVKGAWQRGQNFALGDAPAGVEFSRTEPIGKVDNIEGGVRLPLFQALLITLAAALLTSLITAIKHLSWATPITVGIIVFCLSLWLLVIDSRRLLRSIETVIGKDLDGDGEIGFSVELTEPLADPHRPHKMLFAHFDGVAPLHLVKFAQAAIDDRLTPAGAGLSRSKFNRIRTVARARGLVRWRDEEYHAQGLAVSRGGRAAFQEIIGALCE